MSNEHTKNEQAQDRKGKKRRRPPRRPPRERTREWYHDALVGPEGDTRPLTVARFYVSTAKDEPPEIYFIPMPREFAVRPDGGVGLRPTYRGDIERNGIPLSMLDVDSLYSALVTMKSRMLRAQKEYYAAGLREHETEAALWVPPERSVESEGLSVRRPRRESRPLTHRLQLPTDLVVAETPSEVDENEQEEEPTFSVSLADALKGW